MRAEIVEQGNVSRRERRNKHFFDIGEEPFAINRAIEHKGGSDAIVAKGGNESRRLPMTVRYFGIKPLTAPAASMRGRHVGLRPGLINEHEVLGIELLLALSPAVPFGRDVRPILLGGADGFF